MEKSLLGLEYDLEVADVLLLVDSPLEQLHGIEELIDELAELPLFVLEVLQSSEVFVWPSSFGLLLLG